MTQAASSLVDWTVIDTVLVDMDGTLLDLNFDTFFWREAVPERYALLHGLTVSAAQQRLAPRFEAKVGTLEWYCLDHWARDLDLDLKTLKREHRERIRFLPGAQEFLASMRARGKRLIVVTNAHRDTFAVKAEHTGLDRLVDSVVCSHDFATPKETVAFWHALEAHSPFDRRRTLLIEDSLTVLAAAREYGVRHTLAIRRPDSQLPPRPIDEFAAIDGVFELV
jgi:putative hydrolase of the HAD superfamily